MIRSILVPLDGSAFSEQALPTAGAIAHREGAVLRLVSVHVPTAILPFGGSTPVEAEGERRARERIDARLRRLARRLADDYGITVTRAVVDGPVVESIEGYAREVGADLIAMTTHGRGGLQRAWLGSVADGLVRRTHLPVLLIRPRRRTSGRLRLAAFRRVLLPLDGSALAEEVIPAAVGVAGATSPEFLLLRIVPPLGVVEPLAAEFAAFVPSPDLKQRMEEAGAYLDRVARALRVEGHEVDTRVVPHSQAAIAILNEAERVDADLIAMATHGRGGVTRMVIGSVADSVLRQTPAPLLLLRPEGA